MHDCKKLDYEAQWPRIIHHSRLLKNNGGCLSVRGSGFHFQDPFFYDVNNVIPLQIISTFVRLKKFSQKLRSSGIMLGYV